MEKSMEEVIFETREVIRQVIIESKLNISVVDLIMHDLYTEIHNLAMSNLQNKINERKQSSEEVIEDGGHQQVSE